MAIGLLFNRNVNKDLSQLGGLGGKSSVPYL